MTIMSSFKDDVSFEQLFIVVVAFADMFVAAMVAMVAIVFAIDELTSASTVDVDVRIVSAIWKKRKSLNINLHLRKILRNMYFKIIKQHKMR